MDLHQTGKQSQWASVSENNRNTWQRIASKTNGIITPANGVSVIGAGLAAVGLAYIYQGDMARGLALLIIGRVADIADGMVAARTKTKSPLGETVDAVADKLIMLAALIVFVVAGIVPLAVVVLIAAHNGVSALFGVAAKVRKRVLHPSWPGKLATAFQWGALFLFVGAELLRSTVGIADTAAGVAAWATLMISVILGAFAVRGYMRVALAPANRQESGR